MNYQNESTANILRNAYRYADIHSDDPHTKLGAILMNEHQVIGLGANRLPIRISFLGSTNGVGNATRLTRPKKYSFIEHAERCAIYDAARRGISTVGAELYIPWFACADCARAIIEAGICRVIGHKQMFDHVGDYHWNESIAYGNEMLAEAGVETHYYDGHLGQIYSLFNGEIWEP
jgi:dCMP deaminase